jgi:hypothetical protein
VIRSGDVSWSDAYIFPSPSMKGKKIDFLTLLLVLVLPPVAVIVKIFVPYPRLNLFSVMLTLFINNGIIKRYIDILDLYRYRIFL